MLSKAWFQLSADMTYVCLRITPGLIEPVQEHHVLALLRLSNCRRYQPLGEGIRQAVTLLNTLLTQPDAPSHPPVPIAQRQDARLHRNFCHRQALLQFRIGGRRVATGQPARREKPQGAPCPIGCRHGFARSAGEIAWSHSDG